MQKRKLFILLLTTSVSLASILTIFSFQNGNNLHVHGDNDHVCSGNGYKEIPASIGVSGSKAYWICCTCHSIYLEKPTTGVWTDNCAPDTFAPDDVRYIAPLDSSLQYVFSYPQSKVTDSSLISILNGLKGSGGYIPYYIAIGETYASNSCYYEDILYNNVYYRRIRFTKYRSYNATFSTYIYGHQERYGYLINTTYYFKWEKIEWSSTYKYSDYQPLYSTKLLDAMYYSTTMPAPSFGSSTLYAFINDTFKNAAQISDSQLHTNKYGLKFYLRSLKDPYVKTDYAACMGATYDHYTGGVKDGYPRIFDGEYTDEAEPNCVLGFAPTIELIY